MFVNINEKFEAISTENIVGYINEIIKSPGQILLLILDIIIVIYLARKAVKLVKDTRTGQIVRGIIFLIAITLLTGLVGLDILNYILTFIMTYGVIILIVVFQPELRRALEQLGTSNISKFLGFDKGLAIKSKENVYKIVSAATEMAEKNTGGLIVIRRDIKIDDILNTGIPMNSDISAQLIVNVFAPNTPLHDGALVISDGKIAAAACMLPLAGEKHVSRKLGTRHRAAIGMSRESDALVVVISEETGKISVAKDGTLYADLDSETLKKILIKNLILEIEKTDIDEETEEIVAKHRKEKKNKKKSKASEE